MRAVAAMVITCRVMIGVRAFYGFQTGVKSFKAREGPQGNANWHNINAKASDKVHGARRPNDTNMSNIVHSSSVIACIIGHVDDTYDQKHWLCASLVKSSGRRRTGDDSSSIGCFQSLSSEFILACACAIGDCLV